MEAKNIILVEYLVNEHEVWKKASAQAAILLSTYSSTLEDLLFAFVNS